MNSALILGGAACVFDDAQRAMRLFEPDVVVAVNDIGMSWPRVDIWATLHPDKMDGWLKQRRQRGEPRPGLLVTGTENDGDHADRRRFDRVIDHTWPGASSSGSTGLFAVKAVFELTDCERIVLAGVPMDAEDAHFFDARPWTRAKHFRQAWIDVRPVIGNVTRSMSGWTRELLGEPPPAWLAEEPAARAA